MLRQNEYVGTQVELANQGWYSGTDTTTTTSGTGSNYRNKIVTNIYILTTFLLFKSFGTDT